MTDGTSKDHILVALTLPSLGESVTDSVQHIKEHPLHFDQKKFSRMLDTICAEISVANEARLTLRPDALFLDYDKKTESLTGDFYWGDLTNTMKPSDG